MQSASRKEGGGAAFRREKLVSKILMRILGELENRRVPVTPNVVDSAKKELERKLLDSSSALSEREIQSIVSSLVTAQNRARTSLGTDGTVPQAAVTTPQVPDASQLHKPESSIPMTPLTSTDVSVQRAKGLLMNTSKKQRQMLADEEWSHAAEQDRRDGLRRKQDERLNHLDSVHSQRRVLDEQIEEHERQKEEARRERLRVQQEMTSHIEMHRALTRKEREEAYAKAMKEKKFREQQSQLSERQREEARQAEHDEQVRQTLIIRQELALAKQQELERKQCERDEWSKVLQANAERLRQKEEIKEREREVDRRFQKEYADRLDRDDRDRAEMRAKKDARATYFTKLAEGVATLFEQKQQDLGDKIEAEYQEQLRRSLETEEARRQRNKSRIAECQDARKRQIAEKKRQEDEERRSMMAMAEQMRDQSREAQRQEEARRAAQKAEAQRLKEFLNTQLQMAHFKETRPLETSIARPLSRGKCMFSPSRYVPSPKSPGDASIQPSVA